MKTIFKFLIISFGALALVNIKNTLCRNICTHNRVLDLDEFFDPTNQDIKNPQATLQEGSDLNCLTPLDILQLITPEDGEVCIGDTDVCPPGNCLINVPNILSQNLYKYTNGPIIKRSLLTEPALRDYCLDHCMWHVVAHPFYNWVPRVPFIRNCVFLNSYIDLTNKNVVNEIVNTLEATGCSPSIDVPGILGLFSNIRFQQHRAGVMFAACTSYKNLSVTLRMPIYYLALHYFLSQSERDAIEQAPYFANENSFPENIYSFNNLQNFGERNFVADRAGLGDLRLNALWKVYDHDRWGAWFGLSATIPTAVDFSTGIIGSKFSPCTKIPEFSIEKLFNLYLCPSSNEAIREAGNLISSITTEFLIGALNRLSSILLNAPLGNGGHFELGPHLDIAYKINDKWLFHTYGVFQGSFSHEEYRYFLVRKNPAEFDRDYRNEERAQENLDFLNRQIINTLYPMPIKINVHPVFNLRAAESIECDYGKWHGLVGLDYWYKAAEKYDCIDKLSRRFDTSINVEEAAQQFKIFLAFGYRGITPYKKVFWDLEFTGDKAIWSSNIGQDLTIAFRLTIDF